MRPESTNGTGGGELLVPMDWMYAEYIADELLRTGDLMPPATIEYRAGRDALALTIFLSDGSAGGVRAVAGLNTWLSLTAYDAGWREWVCERLGRPAATVGGPDLLLARAAWRWLEDTELLAPDLGSDGPDATAVPGEGPQVWTPAWQLGLPLGHLAIHLF